MKQLEIYLTTGQVLAVDVETWELEKSNLSGVTNLTWKSVEGKSRRLVHVRLENVVAVIEVTK